MSSVFTHDDGRLHYGEMCARTTMARMLPERKLNFATTSLQLPGHLTTGS
jgi:hypothetical protein